MSQPTRTGRKRLGTLLVEAGLLTDEQLDEALASRDLNDGRRERLGQALVRLGLASEEDIAQALATQLALEFVPDEALVVDAEAVRLVPVALAQRYQLIPVRLEEDGTLVVAAADPTNVMGIDDVRLASGVREVRQVVATPLALTAAIRRSYGIEQQGAVDLLEALEREEEPTEAELADSATDAPIIRLAEGILTGALQAGASDVHVEPGRDGTTVRYRIDGVLHTTMRVPRSASPALLSRLKLMAGMDIAERRRPQDGRSRMRGQRGEVDLRVSTLPSLYGETLVMRLLRKGAERLDITDVGFTDAQLAVVRGAIERPQGLVLMTGPTGSGKTSTLYAFLSELADDQRNIITLEDPVEYQLDGVNQTQIREDIGLSFARALRTVLRQDPDVVMVGEIRDPETAELALQASLTGHLVFSTLHTNDAAGAVVRLRDLGIPSYLIASSLTMVVAQRLVRVVCPRCATDRAPTEWETGELHLSPRDIERGTFRRGTGCVDCAHTGYRGRGGVFEVLMADPAVRHLITSNATETALRHAARVQGMHSLREDGIGKAMAGVTTLEEVLRVTPTEGAREGVCPTCSQTLEPDFKLCPWCGADFRPDACAVCGHALVRGWAVCPECGTPTAQPEDRERLRRVLVVDDDPSVTAAVETMLTGEFEVIQAHGGEEALDLVAVHLPDLVLCDVSMPEPDGYAVTRELRARPVTTHVPVVLMTGADDRETELAGLRAGADDYLTKPLDPDVLAARLDAVLRRTHG